MVSRLLSTLDARISRTRDPVQADCLRAERATVLARQGRLDEARTQLEQVRARHATRPNAIVTAWVCLGEGMTTFYESLSSSSRDKFLRARALSSACGNNRVERLSAAWLAHFEYLDQKFDAMVKLVEPVITLGLPDEHLALERASLVVAQTYHWSDHLELAKPWYERARWHANIVGDETLISALMHNMAWLHVSNERRRALQFGADHARTARVLLGTQASENFDTRIGAASLTSIGPILEAHALSLLGRYDEALVLFDDHMRVGMEEGLARIGCSVFAEVAWCSANARQSSEATRAAAQAQDKLVECDQPDELAAAHGRLAQCYQVLGERQQSELHAEESAKNWALHGSLQAIAMASLTGSAALSSPVAVGESYRT